MTRIFEKNYKYLLANLVPRHRLSAARRKQVDRAIASDDAVEIRLAAVQALEELYSSEYFDRSQTRDDNGHAVLTYGRSSGSYQIKVVVPSDEWRELSGGSPQDDRGQSRGQVAEPTATDTELVETTINILPDIIRSFSINGQRESTLQRLEAVMKFLPRWFSFSATQLVIVEERVSEGETQGERVITGPEKLFQDTVIYHRCRESKQIAVLDASSAGAVGLAMPAVAGERSGLERAQLAVAPVFPMGEFWGVLEAWITGEESGPLLRSRVEIAAGMVEQIIENTLRLENLTSVDKLTGIYNRQFYDRQIRIEMERATRTATKLSLLVVDIDDFKQINDTMGHRRGDEALAIVADLIRGNLRKIDMPFRYGGEEFVILLPGTGEMEAVHTAERLRSKIAECDEFISPDGTERRITVSIGGAVFPDHGRTEDDIFSHADSALYLAKRNGKNRIEFIKE